MRAPILLLLFLTASPALGQPAVVAGVPHSATPAATELAGQRTGETVHQYDLDRIRRELARPDTLRSYFGDDGRVVFRVEVEGQLPKFSEFIGGDQALHGPSPWGSMTHGDFLEQVTPKTAQPYGAFTGGDLLQVLATSMATAFALNGGAKTLGKVKDAIHERRVRAAEQEVQRVLTEQERERQAQMERRLAEEEAAKKKAEEAAAKKAAEGPTAPAKPQEPDTPEKPATPQQPPIPK